MALDILAGLWGEKKQEKVHEERRGKPGWSESDSPTPTRGEITALRLSCAWNHCTGNALKHGAFAKEF